jgi:leucine dehydrogenase
MSSAKDLLTLTPQQFVDYLKKENISRFYFGYNPEKKFLMSSHPQLQGIADFIQSDQRDFMQHEGLFFQISKKYDTLQGAFVHRTNRGQAAGGVRYWHYPTLEAYLRDGMRLAVGMTYKNALAGLWWGGGKGVMAHNPAVDLHDPGIRASLYREYGELVSSIRHPCERYGERICQNPLYHLHSTGTGRQRQSLGADGARGGFRHGSGA